MDKVWCTRCYQQVSVIAESHNCRHGNRCLLRFRLGHKIGHVECEKCFDEQTKLQPKVTT
jgi:hypothetical protein